MPIPDLAKAVLLTVGGLALSLVAIEGWERRYAWPVDPSWYALSDDGSTVQLRCQGYAPVRFSRAPAPGVTRILALGGSTTFGYPEHPVGEAPLDHAAFGVMGAVQASLDAAYPGRFELVDLGVNGGASEDTLRLGRKAMAYGAAAVLVYDGHNELMNLPADFRPSLWGLAVYRRLMLLAPRVNTAPGFVGPAAYGGPAQYGAVIARFRANLDELVDLAQDAGLPVILSTQTSNLAGFDPAWSTQGDPALLANLGGREPQALRELWQAQPGVADLAWAAGRALDGADRDRAVHDAADADGMPIRATRDINSTIREVAEERGLVLVDAEAAVGDGSPYPAEEVAAEEGTVEEEGAAKEGTVEEGPFYDSPFYDNLHPRPQAARRLAGALVTGLAQAGVVPTAVPGVSPALDPLRAAEAERRTAAYWLREACIRRHDPAWRLAQAQGHAERALALDPQDAEAVALRALALALPTGAPVPVADPTLRAHLATIHPDLAPLLRPLP